MPSKSVHKIVDHIKFECEDWGGDLQIDEPSLYRHVEQMLDLEQEPPDLAPVEVVEDQVRLISCIKIEVTDLTTTKPRRGVADHGRKLQPQPNGLGSSFMTSLASIRQPATRTATTCSSTEYLGCGALT